MLQRERPQGVRLGIEVEADALLSASGTQASTDTPQRAKLSREEPDAGNLHVRVCEVLKRAEEASSDEMARDWSVVAATIARRSGRRASLLDALFG